LCLFENYNQKKDYSFIWIRKKLNHCKNLEGRMRIGCLGDLKRQFVLQHEILIEIRWEKLYLNLSYQSCLPPSTLPVRSYKEFAFFPSSFESSCCILPIWNPYLCQCNLHGNTLFIFPILWSIFLHFSLL
jgi:hypothetical protein